MDTTKGLLRQALSVPGAGIHWYGKGEAVKGMPIVTRYVGGSYTLVGVGGAAYR